MPIILSWLMTEVHVEQLVTAFYVALTGSVFAFVAMLILLN